MSKPTRERSPNISATNLYRNSRATSKRVSFCYLEDFLQNTPLPDVGEGLLLTTVERAYNGISRQANNNNSSKSTSAKNKSSSIRKKGLSGTNNRKRTLSPAVSTSSNAINTRHSSSQSASSIYSSSPSNSIIPSSSSPLTKQHNPGPVKAEASQSGDAVYINFKLFTHTNRYLFLTNLIKRNDVILATRNKCSCPTDQKCLFDCVNFQRNVECTSWICSHGNLSCGNRTIKNFINIWRDVGHQSGSTAAQTTGFEPFKTFPRTLPDGTSHNLGVGIRTTRNFTEGELIMEITGEVIPYFEMDRRVKGSIRSQEHKDVSGWKNFWFMELENDFIIDITKAQAKYVNHSCAPNVVLQKRYVGGVPHLGMFVPKGTTIPQGTEICYDYGTSGLLHQFRGCLCGSRFCRGNIEGIVSKGYIGAKIASSRKRIEVYLASEEAKGREKAQLKELISTKLEQLGPFTSSVAGRIHPSSSSLETLQKFATRRSSASQSTTNAVPSQASNAPVGKNEGGTFSIADVRQEMAAMLASTRRRHFNGASTGRITLNSQLSYNPTLAAKPPRPVSITNVEVIDLASISLESDNDNHKDNVTEDEEEVEEQKKEKDVQIAATKRLGNRNSTAIAAEKINNTKFLEALDRNDTDFRQTKAENKSEISNASAKIWQDPRKKLITRRNSNNDADEYESKVINKKVKISKKFTQKQYEDDDKDVDDDDEEIKEIETEEKEEEAPIVPKRRTRWKDFISDEEKDEDKGENDNNNDSRDTNEDYDYYDIEEENNDANDNEEYVASDEEPIAMSKQKASGITISGKPGARTKSADTSASRSKSNSKAKLNNNDKALPSASSSETGPFANIYIESTRTPMVTKREKKFNQEFKEFSSAANNGRVFALGHSPVKKRKSSEDALDKDFTKKLKTSVKPVLINNADKVDKSSSTSKSKVSENENANNFKDLFASSKPRSLYDVFKHKQPRSRLDKLKLLKLNRSNSSVAQKKRDVKLLFSPSSPESVLSTSLYSSLGAKNKKVGKNGKLSSAVALSVNLADMFFKKIGAVDARTEKEVKKKEYDYNKTNHNNVDTISAGENYNDYEDDLDTGNQYDSALYNDRNPPPEIGNASTETIPSTVTDAAVADNEDTNFDDNGNPYYYDDDGIPYFVDTNGELHYYNEQDYSTTRDAAVSASTTDAATSSDTAPGTVTDLATDVEVDANGNPYYYDDNGVPYYVDTDGETHYYDEAVHQKALKSGSAIAEQEDKKETSRVLVDGFQGELPVSANVSTLTITPVHDNANRELCHDEKLSDASNGQAASVTKSMPDKGTFGIGQSGEISTKVTTSGGDNAKAAEVEATATKIAAAEGGAPEAATAIEDDVQYDENSNPYYYDDNGKPYYVDENGESHYYDDDHGHKQLPNESGQTPQQNELANNDAVDEGTVNAIDTNNMASEEGEETKYDKNGNPYYYDDEGRPYFVNKNGKSQYYEQSSTLLVPESRIATEFQNKTGASLHHSDATKHVDVATFTINDHTNANTTSTERHKNPTGKSSTAVTDVASTEGDINYDEKGKAYYFDYFGKPYFVDENGESQYYPERKEPNNNKMPKFSGASLKDKMEKDSKATTIDNVVNAGAVTSTILHADAKTTGAAPISSSSAVATTAAHGNIYYDESSYPYYYDEDNRPHYVDKKGASRYYYEHKYDHYKNSNKSETGAADTAVAAYESKQKEKIAKSNTSIVSQDNATTTLTNNGIATFPKDSAKATSASSKEEPFRDGNGNQYYYDDNGIPYYVNGNGESHYYQHGEEPSISNSLENFQQEGLVGGHKKKADTLKNPISTDSADARDINIVDVATADANVPVPGSAGRDIKTEDPIVDGLAQTDVQHDENGNPCYYDDYGIPYFVNENGESQYYEKDETPANYYANAKKKASLFNNIQNDGQTHTLASGSNDNFAASGTSTAADEVNEDQRDENGNSYYYDDSGFPYFVDANGELHYYRDGQGPNVRTVDNVTQMDTALGYEDYNNDYIAATEHTFSSPISKQLDENAESHNKTLEENPQPYDEYGRPYYYDNNGIPYYVDGNNQSYYYDEYPEEDGHSTGIRNYDDGQVKSQSNTFLLQDSEMSKEKNKQKNVEIKSEEESSNTSFPSAITRESTQKFKQNRQSAHSGAQYDTQQYGNSQHNSKRDSRYYDTQRAASYPPITRLYGHANTSQNNQRKKLVNYGFDKYEGFWDEDDSQVDHQERTLEQQYVNHYYEDTNDQYYRQHDAQQSELSKGHGGSNGYDGVYGQDRNYRHAQSHKYQLQHAERSLHTNHYSKNGSHDQYAKSYSTYGKPKHLNQGNKNEYGSKTSRTDSWRHPNSQYQSESNSTSSGTSFFKDKKVINFKGAKNQNLHNANYRGLPYKGKPVHNSFRPPAGPGNKKFQARAKSQKY